MFRLAAIRKKSNKRVKRRAVPKRSFSIGKAGLLMGGFLYLAGFATHWWLTVPEDRLSLSTNSSASHFAGFANVLEKQSNALTDNQQTSVLEQVRTNQQQSDADLMSKDSARYTLQVASSFSWREADQMIVVFEERYDLQQPFFVYRSTAQSKPLFPLLYGDFASAEEAEQHIRKLPQGLQDKAPFVRRFGTIQQQLANQ